MPTDFDVGAWHVEPDLCRISMEGKKIVLQPRWMDLLVFLARNAGSVVSTDEIIEQVWSGAAVAQDSVYFTVSHLRKELAEDPTRSEYIETIAKRGYRLIAPVTFREPQAVPPPTSRNRLVAAASTAVILTLGLLAYGLFPIDEVPPPSPASIAILPFNDLGSTSDGDFSVGFADNLIALLDTIDGIKIMARASSFSLSDKNVTAQEIGEQLNVATVLTGSVRRDGDKIYVAAQLVKTKDGFHLWADTYAQDLGASTLIQQEIAQQIAEGLGLFMPSPFISTLDPINVPIVLQSRVNNYTENNQNLPGILATADGGYVVSWRSKDQDGSNWGSYGQRFDEGGEPAGDEFRFNTNPRESQYMVQMARRPDGGFLAAWQSWESDGSHWGVVGRVFDAAGRPTSSELPINDHVISEQVQPVIANLVDGGFIVAYASTGQDSSGPGVFVRPFDRSGSPLNNAFQVNVFEPDTQGMPQIATLGNDGHIIIWISYGQNGSGFAIMGRLLDQDGVPVAVEFPVGTFIGGDQRQAEITSLADGGAVAVWQSRGQDQGEENAWSIFGQQFDVYGKKIRSEFAVNTFNNSDQMSAGVTGMQGGGFFVSWMSNNQGGPGFDLYGRRFAADGRPVGAELFINVVRNSDQRRPKPESLTDGSVVVVFGSEDWDGSYSGIFRRRLVFAGIDGQVMKGKSGPDTFVFEKPFDDQEISDFNADIDRIDLTSLDTHFGSLAFATQRNSVSVDTGQGVITVVGPQRLSAGHFLF